MDKVMLNNNAVYKYEIPYKSQVFITQCCINDTVILYYVPKQISRHIRHIKPYTSDKNVEDNNIKKYI